MGRNKISHVTPGKFAVGDRVRPVDIGREICTIVSGVVFGPYLVIDSASQRDRPGLLSDGWVLDADHSVWFDQWKLPRTPTVITITECE